MGTSNTTISFTARTIAAMLAEATNTMESASRSLVMMEALAKEHGVAIPADSIDVFAAAHQIANRPADHVG